MKTKTERAIKLYKNGSIVSAMRIFKTFKLGVDREDKRVLEIAFECLTGHSQYYMDLKICPFETISKARLIVEKTYIK